MDIHEPDIRKANPSGLTTILSMLLSVLGAAMVFVPWIDISAVRNPGVGQGLRNGLMSWHGIVNLVLLIVLFLFLVATSPLKPVPFWRSIPLAAVGFFVLLFTGLFIGYVSPIPLAAGVYFELVAGFGLLFVAALEVRAQVLRYVQDQRLRGVASAVVDLSRHPPRSDD